MGNFNRGGGGFKGGFGGGRPGFQKKPWNNDRGGDRETVMHKAVCGECGKNCEVPFRPSGDKPVYCNNCFGAKKEGGDRGPRPDFGNRGPKRDFNDRPAPHRDFGNPAASQDETKKQLRDINIKLDRLIDSIERLTRSRQESSPAPKTSFVSEKAKEEIKKKPAAAPVSKVPAKKSPVKKTIEKKGKAKKK